MDDGSNRAHPTSPITCHLRYRLNPEQVDTFREYARLWVGLIGRYGGMHSGYFLAAGIPELSALSFPALGRTGPLDVAFALFSFPNLAAYQEYREMVRQDPECAVAERLLQQSGCVLEYERTFAERIA